MTACSKEQCLKMKNHGLPYHKRDWVAGYLFIAPMLVGVLIFVVIPILFSLVLSFAKWNGVNIPDIKWVGLANYIELFTVDTKLIIEIRNTLQYTFLSVPITLACACVVAAALSHGKTYAAVMRCIYYLPNVTMPVAVGLVWSWIFNSQFGVMRHLMQMFGIQMPNMLGDPQKVMYLVIFVSVWRGLGSSVIIIIAGLQSIPMEYYEAAELDGANTVVRFFQITLPLITPSLFFLMITGLMNGFKAFDLIYIFAGRGNASATLVDGLRTLVYGIYRSAFTDWRMGYASAKAVLLFIMILAVTLIQFWAQKKWVYYADE